MGSGAAAVETSEVEVQTEETGLQTVTCDVRLLVSPPSGGGGGGGGGVVVTSAPPTKGLDLSLGPTSRRGPAFAALGRLGDKRT